jgi:ABC-type hemin transport system ATPase subunit
MRTQITQAIALYRAGRTQQCLDLIRLLTQSAQAKSSSAYFWRGVLPPDPLAVYQWLDLAVDRLRKELGEDLIAVVPVLMSLNTALNYAHD